MYNTKIRVGSVIVVYGTRAAAGASTLAAMTAALFAAHGEKTLLLSTDPDIPFDAVSMLSDEVSENHMDDLAVLENSNGLDAEKLNDYVSYLTDNLAYLRASAPMNKLTKMPAKTVRNIIDIACYEFRYVVVDVGYAATPYVDAIISIGDLVVHALTQDPKYLQTVGSFYKQGGFGEDKFVVPIVMGYNDESFFDIKWMKKHLGMDEVFCVHADECVSKACGERKIASFAYKFTKKPKTKFFGFGKKTAAEDEEPGVIDELNTIREMIFEALIPDEEEDDS